jgi:hypothetical protein
MRYKAMFAAGLAVGFIAGTRAGRERYDQMVRLTRQAAGSPPVQKATAVVTAKTTELAKTAAAKAPDLAKTAAAKAPDLAKTAAAKAPDLAKTTVPKIVNTAKQATSRLPFTGKSGGGDADGPAEASDGPHVPYQADGTPASYNGMRAD